MSGAFYWEFVAAVALSYLLVKCLEPNQAFQTFLLSLNPEFLSWIIMTIGTNKKYYCMRSRPMICKFYHWGLGRIRILAIYAQENHGFDTLDYLLFCCKGMIITKSWKPIDEKHESYYKVHVCIEMHRTRNFSAWKSYKLIVLYRTGCQNIRTIHFLFPVSWPRC